MHKKKWSRNLKKSLSIIMIGATILPNIGYALSPNENLEKISPDLTKIELNKELKAERVKIQEGKYCVVGSGIFNGVAFAGDTNKDGIIDIVDAKNIADVYNSTTEPEIVGKDLNYDGVVDDKDMKYVVDNFLRVNEQDENAKEPQKTINGKTLDDILNDVGYEK